MDKRSEFMKLAEDVSQCHICEGMKTRPNTSQGEYLVNDGHGLGTGKPYVNLWNLWNGDLDADIMVIGQDFGTVDDADKLQNAWKTDTYNSPTDKRLRDLFRETFSFDVNDGSAPLFFTNMACCYRHNAVSGEMHGGWLPVCASRFMGRLIRIVSPKIIIVLGQKTFEAMFGLDGIQMECTDPQDTAGKETFESIMAASYRLVIDGKAINVFPVYHPGTNSIINRKFEKQIEDWKRIKKCYDAKLASE